MCTCTDQHIARKILDEFHDTACPSYLTRIQNQFPSHACERGNVWLTGPNGSFPPN